MFNLKKFCLIISLVLFFPLMTFGADKTPIYKCSGSYDVYDDTCYFPTGAFIHFEYKNGKREINKNGKPYGFFFWNGGLPYGLFPYSPGGFIWISF